MDYAQRMNAFAAKCGLPPPETATGAFAALRASPRPAAEPDVLLEAVGDLVKTAASWRERLGQS